MTLIIGFGNKARHGKDEAIQAIRKDIGDTMDVRDYGFGDALKTEVNEAATTAGGMRQLIEGLCASGIAPDWVVFDENAPMDDPLSPLGKQRTLLQWWGTEFRRAQDPNYWVKKLMARIAEEQPDVALIRDLRFPNEFAAIQEARGFCVKVVRVGFVSDVPEHYSERALDFVPDLEWDYIISAVDGNLEGLRSVAVDCFNFIWDVRKSLDHPRTPIAEIAEGTMTFPSPAEVILPVGQPTHLPIHYGDRASRFL